MSVREVNFDGLPGPTHNYAGLARGNLAAERNAHETANPREAALQGLDKMRALAANHQVLCITHLPQIAACGHAHFEISKNVAHGRTQTRVVRLSDGERVEEVARMIGGAAATDASRGAARELLGLKGESESRTKGESESPRRAKAK